MPFLSELDGLRGLYQRRVLPNGKIQYAVAVTNDPKGDVAPGAWAWMDNPDDAKKSALAYNRGGAYKEVKMSPSQMQDYINAYAKSNFGDKIEISEFAPPVITQPKPGVTIVTPASTPTPTPFDLIAFIKNLLGMK